jgi:hypothetical protein
VQLFLFGSACFFVLLATQCHRNSFWGWSLINTLWKGITLHTWQLVMLCCHVIHTHTLTQLYCF